MNRRISLALVLLAAATPGLRAETFRVMPDGKDLIGRDGTSAAWASLAYACERVPAGDHVIVVSPGTYACTRVAVPKDGHVLQGSGNRGVRTTRLVAAADWKLAPKITDDDDEGRNRHEYLIAFRPGRKVTVRNMVLDGGEKRPITGGVFCRDGRDVLLEDLDCRNFRWNGLRVEFTEGLTLRRCTLTDCSSVKRDGSEGGHIRTRWITKSRIADNLILSTTGKGYGYKGGGHVNVRIDHNFIDTGYFAVECAHENEYGVEIDHNHFTRCISVPKPGQSEDPAKRGCTYTFWIHHNLLTDSYTVEGPRNHMRISHNHIRIDKPGGRVYTHHGGVNRGPVYIDRNVIEDVDRAVVWMNGGVAADIHFVHNTVTCADAGDRADFLFAAYSHERLDGWVIKNNVFVAPEKQPRKLFPAGRGVPKKIAAEGNVFVNVAGTEGNRAAKDARFAAEGDRPWAYYLPADGKSPLVDSGVKPGKPFWGELPAFEGKGPDAGALEFGAKVLEWSVPEDPRKKPKR